MLTFYFFLVLLYAGFFIFGIFAVIYLIVKRRDEKKLEKDDLNNPRY